MSLRTVAMFIAPGLVLATMGIGLRLGAEPAGTAVLVYPAPLSAKRDHLVWQLRSLREVRRIRDAAPLTKLEAIARVRGAEARWTGTSNDEGVAEMDVVLPNLAPNETVDLEVRSGDIVLARGQTKIPEARPSQPLEPLRATKAEGPLAVSVFAPPGGIAPQLESRVWVHVGPANGAKVSAEGDVALELLGAPSAVCPTGYSSVRVRAMGLVLPMRINATSAEGATGSWYGSLPVVLGGDDIAIDPPEPREGAPFVLRVRSPTTKPLVYVEVFDDVGRELATWTPLAKNAGFGEASVAVRGLPAGRHFAIASSRPDGFMLGASVARPFRVGPAPVSSCEGDLDVALRNPPVFERDAAIDGFLLRREEAARIRRKGMSLAMSALVTGGLLAVAMLFSALRRATPRLDVDEATAKAITKSATPRWLVVAILVSLSCLAYFLLAGLVLFSGN